MATVKKPKKILMITPFFKPNIGGVENHLDDLCNYLNKKGHQITILTFTPLTTKISAPSFEQQQKHITIHRFSWPGHNLFHQLEPYPILEFLYLTPYLFLRSLFFLIFTKQKFDLIHAHGLNASFVTMLLKKIFKIRTVASTYAIYNFQKSSLFSKITSFTLSSFDKILALAQPSTKELIKIGIDNNKISTYYLWVDNKKFKNHPKSKARQMLNLPNKFTAIFVGRLIPIKGIKIIVHLISIFPNIHFIIVGDDSTLKNQLKKISHQHQNLTLYTGPIKPQKLSLYYSSADLLLFPSLYNEAFGKVAAESLSCGTPVLASNKGAIPDVVSDKVGKVITPTLKNFVKELSYLYKNQSILAKLTKNCLKYAKNNFSIKNAKTIENAYY